MRLWAQASTVSMWKSRNSRFGTKCLYLLSHLAGPVFVFCFERFSCDPGWPPASRSSCLSPQRTGISGRCSYLLLLLLCLVLLMLLESSPRTSRIPGECSANEPSWPPQTNFFFINTNTHFCFPTMALACWNTCISSSFLVHRVELFRLGLSWVPGSNRA